MKTKQRVLLALLAAAVLLCAALWAVTRSNAKAEQAAEAERVEAEKKAKREANRAAQKSRSEKKKGDK